IDQVIANRRLSVTAMYSHVIGLRMNVPLRVVTVLRDPTPAFDDTVASLLRQDDPSFTAAFLDDGSGGDPSERIPLTDVRFALERFDETMGARQGIETYVRDRCGGDDLVVVLPERFHLCDGTTLQRIRAAFDDPGCLLAYGQWRSASGVRGAAEPAPTEAVFR